MHPLPFLPCSKGAVNGPAEGSVNSTNPLCAREEDPTTPAALTVAPCFLPNALAGPYWVLAVGHNSEDPSKYDWAVISGGQPTEAYPDGCTTKLTGTNGSGLWIFGRAPVLPADQLAAARASLTGLGFTLSQLLDVPQAGCDYEWATVKY